MKSSSFMMLLLGAASLIRISGIYQPANVETQPQQQLEQQLAPNLGQIIKQPPPLAQAQLPQQKVEGLVTREQHDSVAQYMADTKLVDRIMPDIIKRIDGKTLLEKIDAKSLAAKVLPYLDITNSVEPSSIGLTTTAGEGQRPFRLASWCGKGPVLIGGGFLGPGDMTNSYLDGEGRAVVMVKGNPKETGYYAVQAYCLSSKLVAK